MDARKANEIEERCRDILAANREALKLMGRLTGSPVDGALAGLDAVENGIFELAYAVRQQSYPMNRTLSIRFLGGMIKDERTGDVSEPVTADLDDFPADLGSNLDA